MLLNLKTALVTGADRGLGIGFVKVLLKMGYQVFAGQFLPENSELVSLESQYEGRLSLVQLDISSDESVRQASKQIKKQTNCIDILINNAGQLGDTHKTIMQEMDFDEMLQIINVNALGPRRVINSLMGLILASQTKLIVNISSEAGSIGQNHRERKFGYCMSKSALNMGGALIHKSIIQQGGRVIQIHPGCIKSYMHGYLDQKAEIESEEAAEKIINVVQMQAEMPVADIPVFIDLDGNKVQW